MGPEGANDPLRPDPPRGRPDAPPALRIETGTAPHRSLGPPTEDTMSIRLTILTALVLGAPCAFAQDYPTRPITLLVPFAAGGPTDIVARSIAASMAKT